MPSKIRYDTPAVRPLRVYAFDPTAGRNLSNYMTINVRHERLTPGPIGKYLAVIDYDASNDCYYEPVDLDAPAVLIRGGLEPSESDPRFHQQMVYAVASETIRLFEFALGRKVKWRRLRRRGDRGLGHQLRVFPHAMQQANAFYDPNLRALVFGYFPASDTDPGANLPGQTVFTCLSHDIVAHETTHALIDGLREFFTEPTSPDTPAFHEAFADIVALFQHFSLKDALLDTINRTGGLIHRPDIQPQVDPGGSRATIIPELTTSNPLVGLARQFGEAMGMRAALRSAIGSPPHSTDLERLFEPHARGAVLVAAVFDAFFTIYIKRTRDLMRIARAGGVVTGPGDLHPDLANRLAQEATKTATHFVNICIRALDYCPPVDIHFGEFLRALITADSDLVPEDTWGYRAELITAFRLRGIVPEDVNSFSEEALCWRAPETSLRCTGLEYDVVDDYDPAQQTRNALRQQNNAKRLNYFAVGHAKMLGLVPTKNTRVVVQAHSFHPIHRVGPDGRLVVEFVAELLQQRDERVDPSDPTSALMKFRGGCTVIFDHRGNVRYVIRKSLGNQQRLALQREFYTQAWTNAAMAPFLSLSAMKPLDLAAIHRGF